MNHSFCDTCTHICGLIYRLKSDWQKHPSRTRISFGRLVGCFNVPSTSRLFRDGTLIYCPLQRT